MRASEAARATELLAGLGADRVRTVQIDTRAAPQGGGVLLYAARLEARARGEMRRPPAIRERGGASQPPWRPRPFSTAQCSCKMRSTVGTQQVPLRNHPVMGREA